MKYRLLHNNSHYLGCHEFLWLLSASISIIKTVLLVSFNDFTLEIFADNEAINKKEIVLEKLVNGSLYNLFIRF